MLKLHTMALAVAVGNVVVVVVAAAVIGVVSSWVQFLRGQRPPKD